MFTAPDQYEVTHLIVEGVTIFVMHVLISSQSAPQFFFHLYAMQVAAAPTAVRVNRPDVSIDSDRPSRFVVNVTFPSMKEEIARFRAKPALAEIFRAFVSP